MNRALRRDWASELRNWGMPRRALQAEKHTNITHLYTVIKYRKIYGNTIFEVHMRNALYSTLN